MKLWVLDQFARTAIVFCPSKISFNSYVAVPCRNSVAYFDHIAVFEVPYCWTSVKGGAHTRFMDVWIAHEATKHKWAPPFTEVQRYGASKAMMWSKYTTELPSISTRDCHIWSSLSHNCTTVGSGCKWYYITKSLTYMHVAITDTYVSFYMRTKLIERFYPGPPWQDPRNCGHYLARADTHDYSVTHCSINCHSTLLSKYLPYGSLYYCLTYAHKKKSIIQPALSEPHM